MLNVTPGAGDVIRHIAGVQSLPEEGGLRIERHAPSISGNGSEPSQPVLALAVVAAAEPGDQDVPIAGGGHVFIEADTVSLLEDKTLDARVTQDGEATFALLHQR